MLSRALRAHAQSHDKPREAERNPKGEAMKHPCQSCATGECTHVTLLRRPNQDGMWRRHWQSRKGPQKMRFFLIRGTRALDLRDCDGWRDVEFWTQLPGGWEYIGPDVQARVEPSNGTL